jgi:hypothetical protein
MVSPQPVGWRHHGQIVILAYDSEEAISRETMTLEDASTFYNFKCRSGDNYLANLPKENSPMPICVRCSIVHAVASRRPKNRAGFPYLSDLRWQGIADCPWKRRCTSKKRFEHALHCGRPQYQVMVYHLCGQESNVLLFDRGDGIVIGAQNRTVHFSVCSLPNTKSHVIVRDISA